MAVGFGLTDTQQMMYAFGDSRRPNPETSRLLESVVLTQISEIIHKAAKVAVEKHNDEKKAPWVLTLEDILFLMRQSPVKIQRLIKYLTAKEISKQTKAVAEGEIEGGGGAGGKEGRISKRCREFLQKIDQGGKLLAACNEEYFDDIYLERLVRNDGVTRHMDDKRYEEFCRARAVGFRGQYSARFQQQLHEVYTFLETGNPQGKVDNLAKDVFSYLAYETLGQLVEMSLLVRRDSLTDPVARMVTPNSVNISYPSVHLPITEASSKPPSTPTPEQTAASKKAEQTVSNACQPISPAEVREVLRRLQQRHTAVRPLARGTWAKPVSNMPLIADRKSVV